jgi:methyl-accepting chemotaxis protein
MLRGNRLALKILLGNAITVVAAIVLYLVVNLALNGREAVHTTTVVTFAVLLSSIALSLSFLYARNLTRNFETLNESATSISRGDLSAVVQLDVENRFPDEVDDLAASINRTLLNLRDLVQRLQKTARHIASSANTLSAAA